MQIHKLTDSEVNPPIVKKVRLCSVCGDSFEHKSELKAHRRAAHPQEQAGGIIDLAPDMLLLGGDKAGEPMELDILFYSKLLYSRYLVFYVIS